jgi:precorrin-4 methylase
LCIFLSVGQIREVAETLTRELDGACPLPSFTTRRGRTRLSSGTLADIARKTEDAAIGKRR